MFVTKGKDAFTLIRFKKAFECHKGDAGAIEEICEQLKKLNLKTKRAYHICLNFQEIWNQLGEDAEPFLKKWFFWATHSRLESIKKTAYTINSEKL